MLRKKLESESGTEIAYSGFLIIYEEPADSGFGLPSLLQILLKKSRLLLVELSTQPHPSFFLFF